MGKLFSVKDEKSLLYFLIEIDKDIWKFLDELEYKLYNESWVIEDHTEEN